MEKESFQLESYLSNGVERIVSTIVRSTIKNPKESFFMMRYAAASKKARKIRQESEKLGVHIPPFLIASITNRCNLHCKGCYARANKSCTDVVDIYSKKRLMREEEWGDIFLQAEQMGIGFILLAGGEPFVRKDVLKEAARHKDILFPIFTNGTLITEEYMHLLDENRNLVPVLSIEGGKETTDARRGEGIYDLLRKTMQQLHNNNLLFGTSVTVNRDNLDEVFEESFVKKLMDNGCKGIVYVEYVPTDHASESLALGEKERKLMKQRIESLRKEEKDLLIVAFPGDEKTSGGCLAAGRGFFHINAYGDAEACPFSPYSDTSLRKTSLKQAIKSPLFVRLQEEGALTKEHIGGCVLFEQEEQVKRMAGGIV